MGVISKDHVIRGVKEGITQSGHGKLAPLKKMSKGDWIIFYSPKQSLDGTEPLQAFTALAQVIDDNIYQVELTPDFPSLDKASSGVWKPFRRNVTFFPCKEAPIRPLIEKLEFITDKTRWGYMFRFGLFEIEKSDFELLQKELTS